MSRAGIFKDENYLADGFVAAKRISYSDYDYSELHSIIEGHCIDKGQPLVISNLNKSTNWDSQVFTLNNLKKYRGNFEIAYTVNHQKRNELLGNYIQTLQKVYKLNSLDQFGPEPKNRSDRRPRIEKQLQSGSKKTSFTLGQKNNGKGIRDEHTYVEKQAKTNDDLSNATNQYKELNYAFDKTYAKDVSCPVEYKNLIDKIIPEYLLPQGDNDLFSLLPPLFKAENFMCYLAQNKTGTPMHRDLCGSMGHNIMTMASPGGYAEWYIVVNEDREKLAAIMKPRTLHDKQLANKSHSNESVTRSSFMESERGWLKRSNLKNSDLTVQVILQEPGDLVIIPSRAYHQVRNVGISVKVAWNRITAQTLTCAFEDQLPLYQIICRPEVFKCKSTVFFTLHEWHKQLVEISKSDTKNIDDLPALKYGRDEFIRDSNKLLDIYLNKILYPEMLSQQDKEGVIFDSVGEFGTVKCDFCHSDVFYRYYECKSCDNYDLCLNCYVMGRSCCHVNDMKMRQSEVDVSTLIDLYKEFVSDANLVFQEIIFEDKSECLDSSLLEKFPNMATICRRVERYRRIKQDKLNTFTCTHCQQDSTVSDLAEIGISLTSIFKRLPCNRDSEEILDQDTDIFVCKNCTERCDSCQPLVESKESIEEFNLVYYAQPIYDERNRGAFFDIGLEKSCNYPFPVEQQPISTEQKYKKIITKADSSVRQYKKRDDKSDVNNGSSDEEYIYAEDAEDMEELEEYSDEEQSSIEKELDEEKIDKEDPAEKLPVQEFVIEEHSNNDIAVRQKRSREKTANGKKQTGNTKKIREKRPKMTVQDSDKEFREIVEGCRKKQCNERKPVIIHKLLPKPVNMMQSYQQLPVLMPPVFSNDIMSTSPCNHPISNTNQVDDTPNSPIPHSTLTSDPPFPESPLSSLFNRPSEEKDVSTLLVEAALRVTKEPAAIQHRRLRSYNDLLSGGNAN